MIRTKLHEVLAAYPHVHMARDPYFVFDDKVSELLLDTPAAVKSIEALMEHGLVHLPYPQMTVQFTHSTEATWIAWMRELPDGSFKVTLFACRQGVVVALTDARTKVAPDASDRFDVNLNVSPEVSAREKEADYAAVIDDLGHIVIAGLRMAVLMTHIAGLERETHEAPANLNKARAAKGRTQIQAYSYVHVGHVYSSDGKRHDYNKTGRRMPIHMRAGHNRNQFFGKDRAERKLIWIPPVLVNYDGSAKPVVEKRVVL